MFFVFSYADPFEPLGTDLAFLEVECCRMVNVDYVPEFDGCRLLLILGELYLRRQRYCLQSTSPSLVGGGGFLVDVISCHDVEVLMLGRFLMI